MSGVFFLDRQRMSGSLRSLLEGNPVLAQVLLGLPRGARRTSTPWDGSDEPLPGNHLVITAPVRDASLTPDQRRIVEWGDGPMVVIAGAGTGKTRVIVERCRFLLEHQEGLLPERILVLTYNVKAAHELQERLDATVGRATRARTRHPMDTCE